MIIKTSLIYNLMSSLDIVIFNFFYNQFKILGGMVGYGVKEGAILYLLILGSIASVHVNRR
ncbi:hypothetical protein NNC19_10340 [Clostridium sp. SHJSY1]|uniref:hypothetical protein n=1 Tax=Clostridium sp. SHJSY1 TaxID=2942483 RepID=UPI002876D42B|nr:hypothetical protein [Clostridium sp. SHJSY1]MDS0526079.1 hypothetical protein [Clostridium sp. SHJSY1]